MSKADERIAKQLRDLSGRVRRLEIMEPQTPPLAKAISCYLSLPGLRGFWPFSSVNSTPMAIDLGASGFDLHMNGTPQVASWNTAPRTILGGLTSGDCWYDTDSAHFDIIGTESYIDGGIRGLTMGAWVYPTGLGTESRYVISKWNVSAAADSYVLFYSFAGDNFQFTIRDSATTADYVGFGSPSTTGSWYFVAGRFDPDADLKIWVNENSVSDATSLLNIQNTASYFVVGARHTLADNEWAGYVAFPFITCTALPDIYLSTIFQQTRGLFGV